MWRTLVLVPMFACLACGPDGPTLQEACDLMRPGAEALVAADQKSTAARASPSAAQLPPVMGHSLSCSEHRISGDEGEVMGVVTTQFDCTKRGRGVELSPGVFGLDPCIRITNGVLETTTEVRASLVRSEEGWQAVDVGTKWPRAR